MSNFVLKNGVVVLENGILEHGDLLVNDGIIKSIDKSGETEYPKDAQIIDVAEQLICPGLIDLHTNGAIGHDFLDASEDELGQIAQFEAENGATGFLPTLCTAPQETTLRASENIKNLTLKNYSGAKILGIHLEGPYFNPKYRRVHPEEHIRIYSKDELDEVYEVSGGLVRLVTLAPELPEALNFIRYICSKGIVAALGHSDATFDQVKAGIDVGISYSTHVFCAMRGIHHREPGAAGASLMDSRVIAEVLSDGLHLHPEIVRMLFMVKGSDGIVLATDAMAGVGLRDGEYWLAGRKVTVKDGKTISSEGRIAGGLATMNQVVKNALNWTGEPLHEVVKCASLIPAKVIGISKNKGSLKPGKDADIIICDENFNVTSTIVEGKFVFEI